jgi:hypothetical protein
MYHAFPRFFCFVSKFQTGNKASYSVGRGDFFLGKIGRGVMFTTLSIYSPGEE